MAMSHAPVTCNMTLPHCQLSMTMHRSLFKTYQAQCSQHYCFHIPLETRPLARQALSQLAARCLLQSALHMYKNLWASCSFAVPAGSHISMCLHVITPAKCPAYMHYPGTVEGVAGRGEKATGRDKGQWGCRVCSARNWPKAQQTSEV